MWETKFKELKVLEYAVKYWSKLHAICLPDKKVDKEDEAEKVDDLINGVDKFDTYNKAGILDALRFLYKQLKDTEVKDGKGLGTLEDFKDDKDQKNTTSEKKQDVLTDDEKLIVESLESFRKAFRDTGVHLKHLASFMVRRQKRIWKRSE